MGNCYMGISEQGLNDAFTEILKFGYMRKDQVRFGKIDINQELEQL